MSIVSYGLGPVGLGATNVVFGTIEAVDLTADPVIPVDLDDEIAITLEDTPDIEVEIDGDIEVTIEEDDINVDISCP